MAHPPFTKPPRLQVEQPDVRLLPTAPQTMYLIAPRRQALSLTPMQRRRRLCMPSVRDNTQRQFTDRFKSPFLPCIVTFFADSSCTTYNGLSSVNSVSFNAQIVQNALGKKYNPFKRKLYTASHYFI